MAQFALADFSFLSDLSVLCGKLFTKEKNE
jgi:hypothetical protein